MGDRKVNELLRYMAARVYEERPELPERFRTMYRLEWVNGGMLCDVWFLSRGCAHDARGGCVMCNYGKGGAGGYQEEILFQIRRMTERFKGEFEDFLLTSSGSLLDDWENPPDFREALFQAVETVKMKRFVVETRADTVTREKLRCFDRLKQRAECYIELGLETGNDWILKHCVNKGMTVEDFRRAATLIHQEGLRVTANVGVGIPFLQERASIEAAVNTVKNALSWGADGVVLFPYHVKQGTLMETMHRLGMYQSVSLWSLIEVLKCLGIEYLDKVQISWYKDYYGTKISSICHSPTTCSRCKDEVQNLLDEYRESQSWEVLEKMAQLTCQCREEWKTRLERQSAVPVYEEIEKMYRKLAAFFQADPVMAERELEVMRQEYHIEKEAGRL